MPKSLRKSKSTKSIESKAQTPGKLAQFLENIESLAALHENQGQAAAAPSEPFDLSSIEKAVQAAVKEPVGKTVQAAVSEALPDSLEKTLDQLDDRFNQVSEQLNKLDTNVKAINARFDSLDKKIDAAAPSDDGNRDENQAQIGLRLDDLGSDLADVIFKFEEKFTSLERSFQDQCKTVNGFVAKIDLANKKRPAAKPESETEVTTKPVADAKEAAVDDDSDSHWQRQKQEMLAKYGGDPEYQPVDQTKEARPVIADADSSTADQNNDSTKPISAADQTEIEKLKSDLNAKLREAEVELSINRARLHQERVEFERNQAALDRRAADLEAKLALIDSKGDDNGGDNGLTNRFKRHLGG